MFAYHQMRNYVSTSIVLNFLNEDLIPRVERGIKLKQSEKKVIRRMPKIVSNSVLMTLLDPCVKNTNKNSSMLIEKSAIEEVKQFKKEADIIKVPRKNYSVFAKPSQQQNKITQLSKKGSLRANSRKTTQSSNLIKLPEVEDDDTPQLREIKRKKQLQIKYYDQIEMNKIQNEQNKKKSIQQKKSSLSECMYHHTYDYHSNIVKVDYSQLKNLPENEEKRSFLDVIKENLDKQIENDRLNKKMKEIQEFNKKQVRNVPQHKIGKVEELNELLEKHVEKQQIDPQIKPYYMFQKSDIKSLSKDIQSYLSQGIKLITHQQSIIEQKPTFSPKNYKIKQQNVVVQRQRKKKKKTLSSQSIIYTYQNKLKQKQTQSQLGQIDSARVERSQMEHEYQSLQLQKDEQYGALSEMLRNHSKNMTIDTSSHQNYIRLPALARNTKIISGRKRNATEQKLTRGLEGIQIDIKTPHSKVDKKDYKSGYFTALAANKQTQSSLQQMESEKVQSARSRMLSKKEVVRDYYSNYKEQFRLKMKKISQVIKLYN